VNGGNGGTAERMAEWQNGRNGYIRTIYGTRRRRRHSNLLYYRNNSDRVNNVTSYYALML
jgi:hypothetical protein